MKLLITGATGYVGQRLVQAAESQGYQIVIAARDTFDLLSPKPFVMPDGVDAILHLAAITDSKLSNPVTEIKAASYLFNAAALNGARVIFVSSQAARQDAPTDYGQTKWQIEQLAIAANGCVVRPGQVYGRFESGLFGVLATVVRKLPCYPAFLPAPKIQPVHVDDLISALLSCVKTQGLESSILNIGAQTPISFSFFLSAIAHYWVRRTRLPLPVPVFLIKVMITALGSKLSAKFGLERLGSLFDLKPMETAADLDRLGITLRALPSGMSRSGNNRRRDLANEGHALLQYVLKASPDLALIRRYARCIEQLRGGATLGLPSFMLRNPHLIALIDQPSPSANKGLEEFAWRLNAAMVMSEASIKGAVRFLSLDKRSGFFVNGLTMFSALVMEMFWKLSLMISKPFYRPGFKRNESM